MIPEDMLPESLLPHAAPMVLLDSLDRVDDESASCTLRIGSELPFVVGGSVPSLLAVELVAQTVGVHVGHASRTRGEPIRVGYLIGVREADFLTDAFVVGEELRIDVRRVLGDQDLATYDGTVSTQGVVRARASVNVYREPT